MAHGEHSRNGRLMFVVVGVQVIVVMCGDELLEGFFRQVEAGCR